MACFESTGTLGLALLLFSASTQAQQDFLLSAWSQVSSTTGIWQHWPHSGTWRHLPITAVNHPDAVTFDPVTERVIWSDSGFQNIQSAFLNGSGLVTLASYPGGNVQGLKVEPTSRLLYYTFSTSSSGGEVRTVHLDTLTASTLVTGLGRPADLALDCPNGMVYYAEGGASPQAARVSVSGGAPASLITSTSPGVNRSFTFTNGMALSPTASMMYICDTSPSSETFFYEMSLSASAITRSSFLSSSYCHHVETNGTHLFSADWLRGVQVAPLSSLSSVTSVHGQPSLGRVMGLHYQHATFTAGACPPTTSTTTTTTTSTTTTSATTSTTTTTVAPVVQKIPSSSSQYYTPFYAVTGVSAAGLTAVIVFVVIKKVVGKTAVTQLSHARPQNYQPQQRPGSAASIGSNVIGSSNMAATHKAVHFQEAGMGSGVSLATMAANLGAAGGAVVNAASWAQTSGHVKLSEGRVLKPEPKVKVVKVKPKPQKNNWMK